MIVMLVNDSDYGSNPNTLDPITIEAADWQVASDKTFAKDKIVVESLNDTKNLLSIVMSQSLDPNEKWYGRVRHLLSTGWTEWSNIRVFTPITTDEIVSYDDIPSRIANPLITTDSNPSSHDSTLFTIHADGYSVIGNATHTATTYFIEDVDSNVIWSNEFDMVNKDRFTIKDIVLNSDTIYRIKCMFHSSSGDTSQIASKTVFVSGGPEINLSKYMDVINHAEDFQVEVNKIDGVNSMVFEVISVKDNNSTIVWSKTTNGDNCNVAVIPANTLKRDDYYYLRVKRNVDGASFKYIPFRADDFTNTDIMSKRENRKILYYSVPGMDIDNRATRLKVNDVLTFTIDYYETLNNIIKNNLDRNELEVIYLDDTGKEDYTKDLIAKIDIIKETITAKKKGSLQFYIRHKTNKDIKGPAYIIYVE